MTQSYWPGFSDGIRNGSDRLKKSSAVQKRKFVRFRMEGTGSKLRQKIPFLRDPEQLIIWLANLEVKRFKKLSVESCFEREENHNRKRTISWLELSKFCR